MHVCEYIYIHTHRYIYNVDATRLDAVLIRMATLVRCMHMHDEYICVCAHTYTRMERWCT